METIRNRNRGEFYTPKHISELMYNETNSVIPDFNKNCVVWDCCWGTGNLTKDIEFNSLYCSTIQKIDIRKNKNVNKGSIKFQYDFLNQDIEPLVSQQAMWMGETSLPEELDKELRDENGKPIVFYINPPYITNTEFNMGEKNERDVYSGIRDIMRERKLGSACIQAYSQFLYRIKLMKDSYKNKDISIAIICPVLFLTSSQYKNFRDEFLDVFEFRKGILFRADEFEGLSDKWGLSIQIYTPGKTEDKSNFNFDVYENIDGNMKCTGSKNIYNVSNSEMLSEWVRDNSVEKNLELAEVTLSSGCKVSNKRNVRWYKDSLGFAFYKGNNVYHSLKELGVMSVPYADGCGCCITENNIDKVAIQLAVRRIHGKNNGDWLSDKDEFCVPNIENSKYKKLVENAILVLLFSGDSHFSSINIDGIDIKNNMYHISADETIKAFKENNINTDGIIDRYMVDRVRKAIDSGLLTEKAIMLLNNYKELWNDTIKYREEFNNKYKEYQVNRWDASFYQIKWVIKEYFPDRFKEFNKLYREFESELEGLIYGLGFIR